VAHDLGSDACRVDHTAAASPRPSDRVNREAALDLVAIVIVGPVEVAGLCDQLDLVAAPGQRRAHLHDLDARSASRWDVRQRQVQDPHAQLALAGSLVAFSP
jgi:hypothetical protein